MVNASFSLRSSQSSSLTQLLSSTKTKANQDTSKVTQQTHQTIQTSTKFASTVVKSSSSSKSSDDNASDKTKSDVTQLSSLIQQIMDLIHKYQAQSSSDNSSSSGNSSSNNSGSSSTTSSTQTATTNTQDNTQTTTTTTTTTTQNTQTQNNPFGSLVSKMSDTDKQNFMSDLQTLMSRLSSDSDIVQNMSDADKASLSDIKSLLSGSLDTSSLSESVINTLKSTTVSLLDKPKTEHKEKRTTSDTSKTDNTLLNSTTLASLNTLGSSSDKVLNNENTDKTTFSAANTLSKVSHETNNVITSVAANDVTQSSTQNNTNQTSTVSLSNTQQSQATQNPLSEVVSGFVKNVSVQNNSSSANANIDTSAQNPLEATGTKTNNLFSLLVDNETKNGNESSNNNSGGDKNALLATSDETKTDSKDASNSDQSTLFSSLIKSDTSSVKADLQAQTVSKNDTNDVPQSVQNTQAAHNESLASVSNAKSMSMTVQTADNVPVHVQLNRTEAGISTLSLQAADEHTTDNLQKTQHILSHQLETHGVSAEHMKINVLPTDTSNSSNLNQEYNQSQNSFQNAFSGQSQSGQSQSGGRHGQTNPSNTQVTLGNDGEDGLISSGQYAESTQYHRSNYADNEHGVNISV